MRERLAIARARSNYSLCAAEAWADPLGVLILRAIDNRDIDAWLRAKWVLARSLARRNRLPITEAARIVQAVLRYLADQRCPVCQGRQFIRQETSVRACLACNGAGVVGPSPSGWDRPQQTVMQLAQAAMGRAIADARIANSS